MTRGFSITAAVVLGILSANRAWGQLNILDQSRSLTIIVNGTAGPTDSNTATGTYNNSINGGVTANTGIPAFPIESDTATASQNSNVTTSVLSGLLQASGNSTTFMPDQDVTGESIYSVDFSVASPTPLSLTGQYTASDIPDEGISDMIASTITLTSTSGGNQTQLFTGGVPKQVANTDFLGFGASSSTSFNTTLVPGVSYNLTVDVLADANADGETLHGTPAASMNFMVSVPEPASIATMGIAVGALLVRRRRK
jgi:hypothetical protein